MLGRLLGFRRRRQGPSILFFIFGGMGLLMSCGTVVLGTPLGYVRSRQVANLPQPSAEELAALAVGTEAIFAGQLALDAPVDEAGLALSYVEERAAEAFAEGEDGERVSQSREWERVVLPPAQVELGQTNGRLLTVQLPQSVTFMEGQRFEEGEPSNPTRRTVGFLPGQALAIHGTWQGNDVVIAETLFGGTQAAYVAAVRALPGQMLLFGLICGGISLLLLGIGVALRVVGR